MSDDEENLLSARMRAAFVADELRPGFAERVIGAWERERDGVAPTQSLGLPLVLGALTLIAAGAFLLLERAPVRPEATVHVADRAAPVPLPAAAPAPAAQPSPPTPDTPEALLAAADRRLAAHEWSPARQLYAAFLGLYANDVRAARAQYGIGETYAGEKRFAEAIGAYTKVIESDADSHAAADAMYKTALAFYATKYCSDAKVYLQKLIERHPSTTWKKDAEARLQRLAHDQNDRTLCRGN
jgi:TolA-binding protein